jgi:mannose-1-phosphate guanylyltransferase
VSIGKNVVVGAGTRIKESIILANSVIGKNTLIMHAVIGLDASVGDWTRVEGTPQDPNPNKPFAKMENQGLFNSEGKLNPAITILGKRKKDFFYRDILQQFLLRLQRGRPVRNCGA